MAEAILGMPVVIKVFGALLLILAINRFCKHLAVAVGAGALALALWCGHSSTDMVQIAWARLSSLDNLFLMLVVLQVIWLSLQMSVSEIMKDLVTAVRARVSRRYAVALLPAVIGLLPMPGGALFSAPLVESCDRNGNITTGLKAQTNHWFRHVWEYWWPLYPGVILALEITRLEIWQFMLFGIPLSICAILAGRVFLLTRVEGAKTGHSTTTRSKDDCSLLPLLSPIVVVIACYLVVRLGYALVQRIWPEIWTMNRYIPMVVGLFCSILVLQVQRPLSARQWRRIFLSRQALNMVLIVAVVRIYGAFIESRLPNGELLVFQMRAEMANWGIPLIIIIMVLPLVSGLATGLCLGFVGASFPIVWSLLGEDPSLGEALSTAALAYGFGYMGMLLSPVHVCLIVTSEYFKTRVLHNIAGMLKPAGMVLACSLLLHWLLRVIIP